jgi:predicted nucleotidyltransferase
MNPLLEQHWDELRCLCESIGVRRLAVSGSVTRSDFGPDRDVDLLVEFDDVDKPGYTDRFMRFAEDAETILGRPVDLLTTHSLRNPYLRRRVESEAVEIHAV